MYSMSTFHRHAVPCVLGHSLKSGHVSMFMCFNESPAEYKASNPAMFNMKFPARRCPAVKAMIPGESHSQSAHRCSRRG